jgi:uncharacterized protein (TIRG00374 family)
MGYNQDKMTETPAPQNPARSYSRATLIAVLLLVAIGAAIIIIDRRQVEQLLATSNWSFLAGAILFTIISYMAGAASFAVMTRVYRIELRDRHVLNIGLVSMVLMNLIGQPAGLSLRILLLGRHHIATSRTVAASLLLSYFKNLFYFALIPLSLLYIVFSHPLPAFGVATIVLIVVVLIVLLGVATGVALYARLRGFVLRGIARIWHAVSRRNINLQLEQFNDAMTLGVSDLRRSPQNRLPLAGTIVTDVVTTIVALWLCFAALGIPVEPGVLLTGFNFGITLTIISFIPGDMGVQEASMAGVFALFGVPFSQGVIAAVLFRVVYYFVPFVLTLPFYWSLLREKTSR